MGADVTSDPMSGEGPQVTRSLGTNPAVLMKPESGGWRVACTCGEFGWWQINNPGPAEWRTIEQHAETCAEFIANAHHQIDGIGVLLGHVPAEVRQLLRDLLDTPAAGTVMRWLADLEEEANGD